MNTVEDTLVAALIDTAAEIPADHVPPLRLPARPALRPAAFRRAARPRFLVPAAAAASVAAVLAASLLIIPGHQPAGMSAAAQAALLSSLPPYAVRISNDRHGGDRMTGQVLATATGKTLATFSPPAPYNTFTKITGAGDDRTFVLAAGTVAVGPSAPAGTAFDVPPSGRGGGRKHEQEIQADTVTVTTQKLFLLRLSASGQPGPLTPLPVQLPPGRADYRLPPGGLAGLALSPDGSKLAIASNPAGRRPADGSVLSIVSVATGKVLRTWTQPGNAGIGNDSIDGTQPLSWTADGRTVEFQELSGGQEKTLLLDTTAASDDLRSARVVLTFRFADASGAKLTFNGLFGYSTPITPDGSAIVGGTVREQQHPATSTTAFTEWSTRTGAVLRRLGQASTPGILQDPQNVLWTSPSGDVLIVAATRPLPLGRSSATVTGMVTGGTFVQLPGPNYTSGISATAW